MKFNFCEINEFYVIGKEGSTIDDNEIVKKLWDEANKNFKEIESIALVDDVTGYFAGFWGLMSSINRDYMPWENNYSKGLYLAGVEVSKDKEAPKGWVKWVVPKREYVYIEVNDYAKDFKEAIEELPKNNYELVGAVCDYTCPVEKKNYMFFPVKKINKDKN